MNKFRKRPNVVKYYSAREINEEVCRIFKDRLHVTDALIDKLGLEEELKGHDGCVNCLEWSANGRFLASGSDDEKVILWDPFRKKLLHVYPTSHRNNIFTVKFLPLCGDTKLVTGAGDARLLALDAVTTETYYECSCATLRIKRIATAPDTADVLWSASEDGIIRQIDLRLRHQCGEEAQNVLINLKNHQGAYAQGKCIAVNPMRTEMLAVGTNDPLIRLYDRRMIKLTTLRESFDWHHRVVENQSPGACTESDLTIPWDITDNLVNGCVQYFVPGHLNNLKKLKRTSVTYLSFSPDGRDLLANMGSEQVYLFDVTRKHAPKYFTVPAIHPKTQDTEAVINPTSEYSNGVVNHVRVNESRSKDLPESIEQLKLKANECFKTGKYLKAIERYNRAIALYSTSAVLFCNRAAAYMKRAWKGDLYAALRDCRTALQLDPDYVKAFFRLVRCFHQLKRYENAKDCLNLFKIKFTSFADTQACRALEKDIETAYLQSQSDKSDSNSKNDVRAEIPTFSWMPYSYFIHPDYSPGGDEEVVISKAEEWWRKKAWDFEHRYCGHCNTSTDIKEANFFGREGRYIVAGSDDGSIFFWDRHTENNIRILRGDSNIVNCLQPHPSYCLLASSGIDSVVRLWTPMPEEGWFNGRLVDNIELAAEKNQKRMKRIVIGDGSPHGDSSSEESLQMNAGCRTS